MRVIEYMGEGGGMGVHRRGNKKMGEERSIGGGVWHNGEV